MTIRFIRVFVAGLSLLLWLCAGSVLAQTSQPVPRLITSTSNGSRPRRVLATNEVAAMSPSLTEANSIERKAFDETNAIRVKNGLPRLAWDADLCRFARNHSANMSRTGFFSHLSPDGLRLKDRLKVAGIVHFTVVGENIAYNQGYDDPGRFAVERWMASAAHRANILSMEFQAMAVGSFVAADGSVFLTQTFITR